MNEKTVKRWLQLAGMLILLVTILAGCSFAVAQSTPPPGGAELTLPPDDSETANQFSTPDESAQSTVEEPDVESTPEITETVAEDTPVAEDTEVPQENPTATKQATLQPTVVPTKKPTQGPDNGSFSIKDMNAVSPADVIGEMTQAVEGVGNGTCFNIDEGQIFLDSTDRQLMEAVYVSTCGWKKGTQVTFSVLDPKGKVWQTKEKVEESGDQVMFRARFQAQLGDPLGVYHFTIAGGENVKLEYDVNYTAQSGPHLFLVTENRFRPLLSTKLDNYKLRFWKFQPDEQVRLYAYKLSGTSPLGSEQRKLIGYRDYKMDGKGGLVIESNARDIAFLAYGQESGEVHFFTLKRAGGGLWDWFGRKDFVCPDAPASKIGNAEAVLVSTGDGSDLELRDQPGLNEPISTTITFGSQVGIQDGPRCADGLFWFQVTDPYGSTGWLPETINGKYVIKAVKQ